MLAQSLSKVLFHGSLSMRNDQRLNFSLHHIDCIIIELTKIKFPCAFIR
jgi:hypothetical protein